MYRTTIVNIFFYVLGKKCFVISSIRKTVKQFRIACTPRIVQSLSVFDQKIAQHLASNFLFVKKKVKCSTSRHNVFLDNRRTDQRRVSNNTGNLSYCTFIFSNSRAAAKHKKLSDLYMWMCFSAFYLFIEVFFIFICFGSFCCLFFVSAHFNCNWKTKHPQKLYIHSNNKKKIRTM